MKILIVDDDATSCRLMRQQLNKLDHKVSVAETGEAAWTTFQRSPFPVVITDWDMPWPDGLELCKRIRSFSQESYTYLIMVSSVYTLKTNFHQAMDAGVDDMLYKPYETRDLIVRLRVAERIVNYHTQIQQLKLLVPICMYCKKVRDDKDYWHEVETFVQTHTGMDFSHGVCPVCRIEHIDKICKGKAESK